MSRGGWQRGGQQRDERIDPELEARPQGVQGNRRGRDDTPGPRVGQTGIVERPPLALPWLAAPEAAIGQCGTTPPPHRGAPPEPPAPPRPRHPPPARIAARGPDA